MATYPELGRLPGKYARGANDVTIEVAGWMMLSGWPSALKKRVTGHYQAVA